MNLQLGRTEHQQFYYYDYYDSNRYYPYIYLMTDRIFYEYAPYGNGDWQSLNMLSARELRCHRCYRRRMCLKNQEYLPYIAHLVIQNQKATHSKFMLDDLKPMIDKNSG